MNGKEFIKAVKLITEEKGISEDVVFEAISPLILYKTYKLFHDKNNWLKSVFQTYCSFLVFIIFPF